MNHKKVTTREREDMHYLEREIYDLVHDDDTVLDFFEHGCTDGIWFLDIENPENEWMSDRFWENFGYDPKTKKSLSSEWKEVVNQDDLVVMKENYEKHLGDPAHPFDQVIRYACADGSTSWVRCRGMAIRDENGKPMRMLGIHTDVTELKNFQERDKIFAALSAIDDMLFVFDLDGVYEDFTGDHEDSRLLHDPIKFVGKHHSEVLPKFVSKRLDAVFKKINHQGSVESFDYMLVLEGKDVWFGAKVTGRYDHDGKHNGYVAVVRDITERKAFEKIMRDHCDAMDDFREAIVEREETIAELRARVDELEKKSKAN